jgi:hypothetical protein
LGINLCQPKRTENLDNIKELEAIGFSLPSPACIFGLILFGVIGYAAYRYGKRTSHDVCKWLGIALLLYPYVVSETWQLYAVGSALTAGIFVFRR